GSLFPVGTTTVTAIATDASLNADTCSFQITVNDNEAPVINSCPSNTTVPANNTGCTAIVNWTVPGATDNCVSATLASTHNPGDVFPLGTTTVTYTAIDGSGNSSTCSFNVTVTNPLNVTINSTMGILECEGHADTLIASGASTYTWNTSSTDDTLYVMQTPGTTQWIVTGTDGNGCSDSDTVNVLVSELVTISMNMSPVDTQCVTNGTVNLSAISAPGGGTWTGPGVTGMTFDPAAAGAGTHTLTYTVANADSCMSMATGTIYVDNCLGMSGAANEHAVILYPNPTNGNFILETEANALVEIYNSLGELMLTQNVVAGKNSLSLENLPDGIYLVKVAQDGGVKVVRVVKGE
ncbi:MAG TPA: HYR domain-containing protein, partial [Bacteroidia bacterium]|nr:HYR domain-containing protein [Bacteroidia bacterium]